MIRRRVLAVILLLVAFLALAVSRAFPAMRDLPELGKSAIVIAGVACLFAGVWLWLRKAPDQP